MPFLLTDDGLVIQTQTEIADELIASFRAAYGNQIPTAPETIFGEEIAIWARREAGGQNSALDLFRSWNPLTASGVSLDIIAINTGSKRDPASPSTIDSGKITGTAATVIIDGKTILLIATNETVKIVDGPYTIPAGGVLLNVKAEAVNTGPLAFNAATPSEWTITTPVVGWDTWENIDDAELGTDIESDPDFKVTRDQELQSAGRATLPSIRANLSQLTGVTFAEVYENVTLVTDSDGIPGKAINAVVKGGDDQVIADEIFASKAGGIEPFGTDVTKTVTDSEGGTHSVSFDRVVDVEIEIEATVVISTSEETYPTNGDTVITQAMVDFGNLSMSRIGQDVLTHKLQSAVVTAGVPGIDSCTVRVKRTGDPFETIKEPISIREQADYSTSRVTIIQA